jgi:nicotinate-nucleotide adenylyltransferase
MNIGVMGGTFDPVHLGHLAVAEQAFQQIAMTEVIFIPAGHPYFKANTLISPAEDRVKMLKLALVDSPHFTISLLEVQRSGPSYAVDTLSQLRKQVKKNDELFFIMGWDSLLSLPRWQKPKRLLQLCKLVAAPRPGYPKPDLRLLEEELPGIAGRTVIMDKPVIDISSANIRERVQEGLPIEHLVPREVEKYIKEKRLYIN